MKIFINARFLTQPITGVQRYAIECSRQIKKQYPTATLLAPCNIYSKEIAAELGAVIIGTHKGHFWEQVDLPKYLTKQGNAPLLNLANTAPIRYTNNFITLHDLAFYLYPQWNSKLFAMSYNFFIPILLKRSKHIFTVSETVKQEIIDNYRIEDSKISVTYNGISGAMIAYKNNGVNQPKKEKIILAVGTFNLRKNHQNLIAGFLQSNICQEYQLVMVGDKNKIFRETGIDVKNLEDKNIVVLQNILETELIELYSKASVVVSVSIYEGFGIPLLEGLFWGCKLLCSDIRVYREIYQNFAHYCNPLDVTDISNALNGITINKDNPNEADLQKLLQKYSYGNAAKTILDCVKITTI